jgi:hypothetical protein
LHVFESDYFQTVPLNPANHEHRQNLLHFFTLKFTGISAKFGILLNALKPFQKAEAF